MGRDYDRLGDAVRDRRRARDQTQSEFAELAGISVKTLQRIESGKPRRDPLALATLSGLDRAADWSPGTADAILRGEEDPTAAAAATDPAVVESSALLVWTAQRTGGDEAVRRAYADLADRVSRDTLKAITQRVTELGR